MILDEFARPVTPSRFAHGADRSRLRGPQYTIKQGTIDDLIPSFDRRTLVSLSQRLYINHGILKAVIDQKAEYSVGDAFLPQYQGKDETGQGWSKWLKQYWFEVCSAKGGVYDWHQLLKIASIGVDREGECFALLTESEDKLDPQIQFLPAFRIQGNGGDGLVEEGRHKGERIVDGIIYNKTGKPLAYRYYTSKDDFTDYPAESIIHLFDPRWERQGRGLPTFTHGIENTKHALSSTDDERRRQAIVSRIGLIVYNELGGPDLSDPSYSLTSNSDDSTESFIYENREGVQYFESGQGHKLEPLKHETPGDIWENFHDRLTRETVVGAEWAYSLVWKPAGQGTAERGEIARARNAVKSRQRLLKHFAKRACGYAVAHRAGRNGSTLPRLVMGWTFSKPPRLSVDDGREEKAMNEGLRLGTKNISSIVEANGTTVEEFYRTRARDIAIRQKAKEAAEQEFGIKIDDREMLMLTPNEQPKQTNADSTN